MYYCKIHIRLYNDVCQSFLQFISDNYGLQEIANFNLGNVVIEKPQNEEYGHFSTNVAMVFAKQLKRPPREIATKVADILQERLHNAEDASGGASGIAERIASVSVAGPGFINFKLTPSFIFKSLLQVCVEGESYGRQQKLNKRINIEFGSPNPTGPMHIAHCRGAVFGDVVANIYEFCGYDITKEYYVNDAGSQIKIFSDSVIARYKQLHGLDIASELSGKYPGEYVVDIARKLKEKFGDALLSKLQNANQNANIHEMIACFSVKEVLEVIKEDLRKIGVNHDIFSSEKEIVTREAFSSAVEYLKSMDYVYEGTLEKPKGLDDPDWEPRQQLLFRTTMFGDDSDRSLVKSDGSQTYYGGDIVYHQNKISRGFDKLILVLGNDHGSYAKRIKAAVKALSDTVEIDVKMFGLVFFIKDGSPFKMSKRAGDVVGVDDVLQFTSRDAIRFMMLSRRAESTIDFDFNKVQEQSKDNQVFYTQYAYSRCCSILRNAAETHGFKEIEEVQGKFLSNAETANNADIARAVEALGGEQELALSIKLIEYPQVIQEAMLKIEPYVIINYIVDVCSSFHSIWNLGKEDVRAKFNSENLESTAIKLLLVKSLKSVMLSAFNVLGIDAPERM